VSNAIGVEATLILAGAVPMVATAALFFVARLRADEERHPLAVDEGRRTPTVSASPSGAAQPGQ
jgi:hypothetical protein